MAKSDLPKKTRINKKVLIAILYHDKKISLLNLIKELDPKKNEKVLVVLDKIKNLSQEIKIKKRFNVKFLTTNNFKNQIPKNRNLALKYIKDYFLILFIDSDIKPSKNLVNEHVNFHSLNKNIHAVGGEISPSFKIKFKNIWHMLDGCMSWFTSVGTKKYNLIKFPYHLPTSNLSIKCDFLRKKKIFFNEKLETGEDVDFCNQLRKKGGTIALINNAKVVHFDRSNFISFFKHQIKWGFHQYYTLYSSNFRNSLVTKLYSFLFLLLYPLLMPFINFISSILVIFPWVKKNPFYIVLFPLIFITYIFKGVATYIEFLRNNFD